MDEFDHRHFVFERRSGIPRGALGTVSNWRLRSLLRRACEGLVLLAVGLLFYLVTVN